jgi:ATP-dependent Clp protease ATP-binding subunit ClpC
VVEWDEAALDLLLRKGFSAELGARPLKRAVEQLLLAPLAAAIVSRSFPEGDQFLFVTARDDRIEVEFVDPDAPEEEPAEPPPSPASLRLDRLVLSPSSGAAETELLQAETRRLRGIVDGEGWHGRKERDLEAMKSKAFWDSPERFTVLGRIEYVDRVEALLRTAEKLSARLARPGRGGGAQDLVELLATRLFLLDRACTAADAGAPTDSFLEIRWPAVDRSGAVFATQLRDMYEAWAERRGMRVQRLTSASSHLLAVSGIAAHPILATETGLHVFETPRAEHSFGRVAVRVAVAPSVPAPPDADVDVLARSALDELPATATVVRRYRTDPSPLVRDSVHEWRTGRLDRVLAGEFDVMAAG